MCPKRLLLKQAFALLKLEYRDHGQQKTE